MTKIFFNNPLMLGFEYMAETLEKVAKCSDNYPPYNIELLGETKIYIKLAVAGFVEEELTIYQEGNNLIIKGEKHEEQTENIFIHRGISFRKFQKSFVLADGVEPCNSYLENGILVVELNKHIPHKDIKTIQINKKNSTILEAKKGK
jgi:HSP20 family molecular chaperone IbpA